MSIAPPRGKSVASPPPPPPADAAMLDRCRRQDPIAFRAFVVRHERMVFALLSRMLGHGPEVEDLAQETFVRAFRAFPSFDPSGPAKVSTWLLTIAVRLALDSRKKRRLDAVPLDSFPNEEVPSLHTPERALEQRRIGDALAAAAAQLPDDQRAALVLAELHGLSLAEIAGALEVPENTVKTRLFRAREKMRAALTSRLGTDWRTS
ncbi:MAG: sigma-70 family RNA polymerase sigma factor [Labilithrix sp.]|nr:sigma-70 family RNA polymerase sigma factor [Labilithrix sp.]MCW5809841.1 sigma-70 family RNA polymerase sigma factor [Labilithrix sp.]